ncbi:MAG: HAD family hydrolase [Myxococcaceae bacterium]
MRRIETVLFDLGNVLAFHDNGLLVRRFAERTGRTHDELLEGFAPALWDRINRGTLGEDALRLELNRRFRADIGPDEFFQLWNCHFTVNEGILPHVEALLGRVKVLLLSNTNELHARFLRRQIPLLERFDRLLLSHELGLAKPDEAIYRAALEAAGTAPEATAFFDDIPEYVEAACRLGIRALVFKDTEAFPAQLGSLGLR